MSKIFLENICKESHAEMPEFYKNLDTKTFGIDWQLHDYQQKALINVLNYLFLYYNKKDDLINYYKTSGVAEYDKELSVYKEDNNFEILSEYYKIEEDKIDFSNFINRASFWMATGSGKTLVIIKLLEELYQLASNDLIPKNDILLLSPKPEILNQIKEHIEIFNQNGNLKIELKNLTEWEQIKQGKLNLYDPNTLTVFYAMSHHFTEENKEKQLDYKTYLNNGEWYVLLDEAHKGDSEDSKRQQYYTLLSQNGVLFNFSATFTDTIDIATTVYNFNLKKFIDEGYGKHIKVSDEEFNNFNKRRDSDFTDKEKYLIVLKSLIILTAIKKEAKLIRDINKSLYHNPLLITVAKEINTKNADLKLFFEQLKVIASNEYELEKAKNSVIKDLNSNKKFQFNTEEIPTRFINLINDISKEDILKNVFHASSPGAIEYTTISNNSREIAFRLKTAEAGKHFALLVASEATNWSNNILSNYEFTNTPVTKSYFKDISNNDSEINLLLGARIFTEGWDSNRPNVINFINIGVNEDAQKFVLQATGRGVRIQPINGVRKRLNYFSSTEKEKLQKVLPLKKEIEIVNNKNNLALESLHIFATNKEVISKIIENLNKNKLTKDWRNITSVQKNEEIEEDLLIATYKQSKKEIPAYNLSKQEFNELTEFVKTEENNNDKILLMQCPDNVSSTLIDTLKTIRTDGKVVTNADSKNATPFDNLLILNKHFHQEPKELHKFKRISNEIVHFANIQVADLNNADLEKLEERITEAIENKYLSDEELQKQFKDGNITWEQLKLELEKTSHSGDFTRGNISLNINRKFLKEHYYKPIIIANEGFEEFLRHVVTENSEKEFLNKLSENKKLLEKYDWWYFSKIDEYSDHVSIPYYDSELQKYREFFPDFIFWLKKDNNYYIKFIDPKGLRAGWVNAEDKIKGYENIFNVQPITDNGKNIYTSLNYYNNPIGRNETLNKYTTKDFEIIFKEEN